MARPLIIISSLAALAGAQPVGAQKQDATKYEIMRDEVDPIQPTKVSHHVDEINESGKLAERYNYIIYEFSRDNAYIRARAYFDEIEVVSIYGPFAASDKQTKVSAPALEADVLAYLKRRYQQIDRFTMDEKSEPYVTIWRRPSQ